MNESKFDKQVKEIKGYVERDDKKCLVINGSWGIGKTYLWKQVEKKFEDEKNEDEKNTNKEIVYIDLFGKESYKQILEEIVFKLYGKRNEALKEISKLVKLVKLVSTGLEKIIYGFINIGFEALFSLLEKKDFKNIIVCFDNIERKSDNLALKDIIGLVNLLKEDKECNVVMIFNKEELNKLENKESDESKDKESNWYETYKEKFVDYELTIKNNDEVAKDIIKTKLNEERKDGLPNKHEEHKERVEKIIFELFKQLCDNNLRLLFKFIEHIRYSNQECFFIKHYDKDDEAFFQTLELYYEYLLNHIKEYYSLKNNKSFNIHVFQSYFDNFFNLSELQNLTGVFEQEIKSNGRKFFEDCKNNYLFDNLNNQKFAKCIRIFFSKFENFAGEFQIRKFNYYKIFFKTYEKITGEKLDCEENFDKFFIEILVAQELNSDEKSPEGKLKEAIDGIKEVIDENEKYKKYYEKLKKEKYKNSNNSIEALALKRIPYSDIQKFNDFTIDSIEKCFRKDNGFCKEFFLYFSKSTIDKYDLNNNLFQAYKNFLNKDENKIKKEFIRKILGEEHPDCLLLKLLEEQPFKSK